MKLATISLRETNKFSDLFLDYIEQKNEKLEDFYTSFPLVENFKKQIADKRFSTENRKTLCQVLSDQYKQISTSPATDNNISLLSQDNTFTITTGHQLNIFTGPLYFIYKIVTVIATCKQLSEAYPDYNFIPVYWMASEDHDFDEIDHFVLEGKKYKWNTDQKGAVGRFDPSTLLAVANEVPGTPQLFKDAYSSSSKLSEACLKYINELFGDEGIVVIDADDNSLKQLFGEVIKDDLLNHSAKGLVDSTTERLEKLGYKTQVYPRDINFFYLEGNTRERIERKGNKYEVLETDVSFTKDELLKKLEEQPEQFSPNVILRPLYQEMILPNLAYIGGPSEVAYWFQLKGIFDYYKVNFPLLMPRNFAAIVPDHVIKKVDKTQLKWEEFFEPEHELHRKIALKYSSEDILLNGQTKKILELFDEVRAQAEGIDETLIAHVEAQAQRTKSRLKTIEKKFVRAEKRKQSDKLNQIDAVLSFLFPNNSLQERTENFLLFYRENPDFIEMLLEEFDPFNFKFYLLADG